MTSAAGYKRTYRLTCEVCATLSRGWHGAREDFNTHLLRLDFAPCGPADWRPATTFHPPLTASLSWFRTADIRIIAEEVGSHIEAFGRLPSERHLNRTFGPLRTSSQRYYYGLAVVVNVSNHDRSSWERWTQEVNSNTNKVPTPFSLRQAPKLPFYVINAFSSTPDGVARHLFGGCWSLVPEVAEVMTAALLQQHGGGILAAPPTSRGTPVNGGRFVVIAAPVFVHESSFVPGWWNARSSSSSASQFRQARPVLRLAVCKNHSDCPLDVAADGSDGRVLLATMTSIDVRTIGPTAGAGLPTVVPGMQSSPARGFSSGIISQANRDVSSAPSVPNGSAGSASHTNRLWHAGWVLATLYHDRIAGSTMRHFKGGSIITAAEDVTGVPGFDLTLRDQSLDSTILSMANSLSGGIITTGSKHSSGAPQPMSVQTSRGAVSLQSVAPDSPVYRYDGGVPFGSGIFLYAVDAAAAAAADALQSVQHVHKEAVDAGCRTVRDASTNISYECCPPQLTSDQFQQMATGSVIGQSYILSDGGRVWHIRVATSIHRPVQHRMSTLTLAAGTASAVLLTALILASARVWDESSRRVAMDAARKAHELTVQYG